MRTALVGAALLLLGLIAIATGVLPLVAAADLGNRVWPILLFVIAITIVTELAADAGLFTVVAARAARWGHGRTWLLWLLVVLLASVSTIFLSLDTTAVLLTPVIVVLARHVGLNPLPFAITTVWLANTGSLLLPVSNLTNLLAQHQMGNPTPLHFAALTAGPALVSIVLPAAAVFLFFRRSLTGRYSTQPTTPVTDRVLLVTSASVVTALLIALVSGAPVWIPACLAALVLLVVFLVRRRPPRLSLIPWQLVLLASGLFLVIAALHSLGLGTALAQISGTGEQPLDLLRLAGTGLVGSNAIDNLPAYLALEPAASSPLRLVALLIGVNVGALITPWASLAILLWHDRLNVLGVTISWRRYMLLSLSVAPLTVVAATLTLIALA